MPYCPSCGSEFAPSVARCPDCDAALTSKAPLAPAQDHETQERTAVAYVADDETEATMISDLLTDSGITNSLFTEPKDPGIATLGRPSTNLRVEVLEDDLAAAKRLIADFKRDGPTPEELDELAEESEMDESDDEA
jgi:hypothetical protein